ncbi:hypothetical protein, partial [Commensalibacter nepenthis]
SQMIVDIKQIGVASSIIIFKTKDFTTFEELIFVVQCMASATCFALNEELILDLFEKTKNLRPRSTYAIIVGIVHNEPTVEFSRYQEANIQSFF